MAREGMRGIDRAGRRVRRRACMVGEAILCKRKGIGEGEKWKKRR
jgi:hypothetical protein